MFNSGFFSLLPFNEINTEIYIITLSYTHELTYLFISFLRIKKLLNISKNNVHYKRLAMLSFINAIKGENHTFLLVFLFQNMRNGIHFSSNKL